jgi:hypothetical protein
LYRDSRRVCEAAGQGGKPIFFLVIDGMNARANLLSQLNGTIALNIFALSFVACTISPVIVWTAGFHCVMPASTGIGTETVEKLAVVCHRR